MPITLITGPANAGKAELVMDAVRRELAHGREPLLIVPTRADVETYRRQQAGAGAVGGARRGRGGGAREQLLAAVALRESEGRTPMVAASARALARFIAE